MKGFSRRDLSFSLCGLCCALCPMNLDGYCPGCGGGEGNQPCAIARCSLGRPGVEYCFQCGEYPCARYEMDPEYDLFITCRNRRRDLERAERIGPETCRAELERKRAHLKTLLAGYNDGRRKSFYCVAVNLLELGAVEGVMERLAAEDARALPLKERAELAARLFREEAARRGVELRLRRKPTKRRG